MFVYFVRGTMFASSIMKLGPCHLTLMVAIAFSGWAMAADPTTQSVAPDEALSRLKAGNERFAQSKVSEGKPVAARRTETAKDQHPFAIVVGCADSRTAPEIIFDQNIGDLFVIRTAGNLVDRVRRLNARFFGTTLVQ